MTRPGVIGASCGAVVFLSLITPCFSLLALTNNQDRTLEQKVESIVEAGRREIKLPGVSIVIARGNKVLLAKGYGLADPREKYPCVGEHYLPNRVAFKAIHRRSNYEARRARARSARRAG